MQTCTHEYIHTYIHTAWTRLVLLCIHIHMNTYTPHGHVLVLLCIHTRMNTYVYTYIHTYRMDTSLSCCAYIDTWIHTYRMDTSLSCSSIVWVRLQKKNSVSTCTCMDFDKLCKKCSKSQKMIIEYLFIYTCSIIRQYMHGLRRTMQNVLQKARNDDFGLVCKCKYQTSL